MTHPIEQTRNVFTSRFIAKKIIVFLVVSTLLLGCSVAMAKGMMKCKMEKHWKQRSGKSNGELFVMVKCKLRDYNNYFPDDTIASAAVELPTKAKIIPNPMGPRGIYLKTKRRPQFISSQTITIRNSVNRFAGMEAEDGPSLKCEWVSHRKVMQWCCRLDGNTKNIKLVPENFSSASDHFSFMIVNTKNPLMDNTPLVY